ncbi:MAG: hypothetical protein KDC44_22280, partial [Phaeodactylibacter sp.]|nr:hypothetical protein [Phaeodactylibacter sp.]
NEGDRRDDRRDQVRDRANKLDDQRDRRDDRFDLAAQKERTQRQKVIFEALTAHDFQTEAKDKMHLVSEFADLMEADLRALKQELGEDLQESREDRRERRDDRNERRENY